MVALKKIMESLRKIVELQILLPDINYYCLFAAKAFKDLTKKVPERPCGRELPCEDVRKMGANVSRHSSKGLSGRRSESSGSICKTKKGGSAGNGTQPQPVCGSLPSYLEASNNNHDYEKQPINDVSAYFQNAFFYISGWSSI